MVTPRSITPHLLTLFGETQKLAATTLYTANYRAAVAAAAMAVASRVERTRVGWSPLQAHARARKG